MTASERIQPPLSNRQLAAIVDALPGFVFATAANGDCIYVNEPWGRLLDRPLPDLLGRGWAEFVDPEDREEVFAQWMQAVENRAPFSSLHRFVSTKGPVWMAVDAVPVWDQGELVGYAGSAREVPQEILDTRDLASRCLAHDLRNMLAVAVGNLELEILQRPADEEVSGSIRDALARASEIAGELLGETAARVPTDLNALVESVVRLTRPLLPDTVHTHLDLDPSLEPIRVYAPTLWRALVNLLFNARDAMPDGGELVIETRRVTDPGAPHARITLRDTGVGIPERDVARIFKPYATSKHGDRIGGLGLAVVDACARLHDGRVEVESREGKGTVFHLELPL